jgi:outer membrane protein assembly factor BamB
MAFISDGWVPIGNQLDGQNKGQSPSAQKMLPEFGLVPKLKWRIPNPCGECERATWEPLASLWNGCAYVAGNGKVVAMELRTGKAQVILKYDRVEHSELQQINAIVNGVLYFSHGRKIRAFDVSSAKLRWEYEISTNGLIQYGDFTCAGEKVLLDYCMKGEDGVAMVDRIVCIDPGTGKETWFVVTKSETRSFLLVVKGMVIMWGSAKPPLGNYLAAVDTGTGKEQWCVPFRTSGGVITDGERIYSSDGCLAMDPQSGKTLWQNNDPVLVRDIRGTDLFATKPFGKELIIIDGKTGARKETTVSGKDSNYQFMSMAMRGDVIFTPCEVKGQKIVIKALSAVDFKELWTLDPEKESCPPFFMTAVRDGYMVGFETVRGEEQLACYEDARYTDEAAHMVLDPVEPTAEEKALIAQKIKELGDNDYKARVAAREYMPKLGLKAEQALIDATKSQDAEVAAAAKEILPKLEWLKPVRDYVAEYHPERDPLYITKLVRHTADLAIQQKAIDRLKKITGQDFGLKPSAEWVKDQKEASDKYDAWWQTNRDKLKWSDKDDKYVSK